MSTEVLLALKVIEAVECQWMFCETDTESSLIIESLRVHDFTYWGGPELKCRHLDWLSRLTCFVFRISFMQMLG